MSQAAEIRPLGDTAVTVRFGAGIDPAIHARVLGFARALETRRASLPGIVDWLPAFDTVSVYFDPDRADPEASWAVLRELADGVVPESRPGRRWRIPVCFDPDCAPDLAELAAAGGIDREDAIDLLTGAVYRVYMLGFLPGFPYMGGLPPACDQPRRATPRKLVPARSFAAAAGMCAFYPWDSPGGWHLVGRTPVRLFEIASAPGPGPVDVDRAHDAASRIDGACSLAEIDLGAGEGPALFAAGDEVRVHAVSRAEYDELDRKAAGGRLTRADLLDHARA